MLPRWCHFDRCHEFTPAVVNAIYCPDCRCKRKAESSRKRLEPDVIIYDEAAWTREEARKEQRAIRAQQKNEWLFANKTFATYDIEASNLAASIGEMICVCVRPLGGPTVTFSDFTDDKNFVDALGRELEKYDYIIGFYSSRYDLKFINTRLMIHGFEPIRHLRHIDLYDVAKSALKLHSNRLGVVAETLVGDSLKTRVLGPEWMDALRRHDEKAMAYIIDHCQRDVKETEAVFHALKGFINVSATKVQRWGGSGYVGLI